MYTLVSPPLPPGGPRILDLGLNLASYIDLLVMARVVHIRDHIYLLLLTLAYLPLRGDTQPAIKSSEGTKPSIKSRRCQTSIAVNRRPVLQRGHQYGAHIFKEQWQMLMFSKAFVQGLYGPDDFQSLCAGTVWAADVFQSLCAGTVWA